MGVALGEEFGGLGGVNVLKDTLKVQMDVKFVGLVVLLLVDSVLIFVEWTKSIILTLGNVNAKMDMDMFRVCAKFALEICSCSMDIVWLAQYSPLTIHSQKLANVAKVSRWFQVNVVKYVGQGKHTIQIQTHVNVDKV